MRDTITLNGVTYGTTTADIIKGTVTLGESLTASELSVDTLTVEVTARHAPEGVYGDPVTYSRDGDTFAKFYLRTIERVGKNRWKLDAISAVGLLDGVKHYGGIYSGDAAETVIADIIGDAFDYTVDGFTDVRLYGWLPIASRRDNLQQVLFAIGGNITKDDSGDVVIAALDDPSPVPELGNDRIFLGGKVTYPVGASAVRVTEHSYVKGNEAKELYSGEVLASVVPNPSGSPTTGNLYSTSMTTSHWFAGGGLVADATGLYDSVILECDPMNTYVVKRTRLRASGDVLRICWLKELPVSFETVAYDNAIAPTSGTVGETMTAQTTTGLGARYLLITYGRTEDTAAKNTLDVRRSTYAGMLVVFSEPMWGLECAGATIYGSGANYAILSPSPAAILTGKTYIHNQKIITAYAEDAEANDYVPEVKDCTLVSLANSANVAKRVLAYYSGFKRVEQDIVVEDERPGDRVILHDPYGEKSGGYIKTLNLTMGALLRGRAVFETGYTPTGIGNNYKDVQLVTASGTVTLPDTNLVRLVLIGGGTGGNGGYSGEDGKQPTAGSASDTAMYAALQKDGDTYWRARNTMFAPARLWLYAPHAQLTRTSDNGAAKVNGVKMTQYIDQHPELGINPDRVDPITAKQAGYGNLLLTDDTYIAMLAINSAGTMIQCQNYKAVAVSADASKNWRIYETRTPGGAGGAGGVGGTGGKIHIVDMEITPESSMTVVIGTGGAGGDRADGAEGSDPNGSEGTATTVTIGNTTLTSADGGVYPDGYFDIIGGNQYGAMGASGTPGGAGGDSEGYVDMYPGENVGTYTGGAVVEGGSAGNRSGSGGGASGTSNGGDGTTSTSSHKGAGGAGASANSAPAAPSVAGTGGTGGYGGGGGGNAAGWSPTTSQLTVADKAPGGKGSAGGVGASGAVLIYYGDPVDVAAENALKDWYRQAVVDADNKDVVVTGGYRSKYSGWQMDDFITEVLGE